MKRYIWLSHPLDPAGPHPPAIPDPRLETFFTIEKDGASVHLLTVASHTGTHLDAPRHVIEDGLTIHEWSPLDLIYTRPVVVDMHLEDGEVVSPADLEPHAETLAGADIALFRFGYGDVRTSEPKRYGDRSPGFGTESAAWIRGSLPDLRALGMDVPSLACIAHLDETMAAHNVLLDGKKRKFLVIEEMVLSPIAGRLVEVRVSPWLVAGMDSGPATIVGIVEE